MALPTTVSRHMAQAITVEPYAGQDGYGKPTYGTAVTYDRCRVVRGAKPVINDKGQEARSMTQVHVDREVSIDIRSRVTLPDGTRPPIVAVLIRPRSPVGSDLGNTEIQLA